MGAAGASEQGHLGSDILLRSQIQPQGCTSVFELLLKQKSAVLSGMKPAELEMVGVSFWFISVLGGFRLD